MRVQSPFFWVEPQQRGLFLRSQWGQLTGSHPEAAMGIDTPLEPCWVNLSLLIALGSVVGLLAVTPLRGVPVPAVPPPQKIPMGLSPS